MLGERGDRDARGARVVLADRGRRDADDVVEPTVGDRGTEARIAHTAVEPVPRPTVMPDSTHSTARSAAARWFWSAFGSGTGGYGFFSSWPPNSLRIADSTRSARSASPRDVNRS